MNNRILAMTLGAAVLMLAGCVTPVPLDPLPKGEEVFRLPPEQILKDYPLINGLSMYPQGSSERIYERFLTLSEVSKEWGEPVKSETNWTSLGRRYALAGIAMPTGSPALAAMAGGIIFAAAPSLPKDMTWEKGNYQITGVFDKMAFDQEPRLVGWSWKRKEADLSLQDISPGVRQAHLFFVEVFNTGGSVIARSRDGKSAFRAGDSTRFVLGWNVPLENHPLNFKIGGGIDYSGWITPASGTRLTYFPIEAALEYGERASALRLAVGATTAVGGNLHAYSFEGWTKDFPLDVGFGQFIQIGLTPARNGPSFGLRYSRLPLSGANLPTLDAGGIGFMLGGFDF